MRAVQFILFSLLLASQSAFADLQLNMTPGVTPVSHQIYTLHMTIFWICVAIGAVVFGIMFYSIIHHRKSKGAKAANFHEHLWVEIIWTIVPLLILIFMAIPATKVLIKINDTAQPDLTVKITGFQWKWKYEYLDKGVSFFSNNATPFAQMQNKEPKDNFYLRAVDRPLVIPIHKKIRFLVTANDVIHSWWVPDFGVKRDAVPGFINESWTRVDRPGTYYGQCAELCGINHAYMPIVVIALPEKDFEKWLASQKNPSAAAPVAAPATQPPVAPTTAKTKVAAPATPVATPAPVTQPATQPAAPTSILSGDLSFEELMKHGQQVYETTCAVCHQPNGEGMPPTFPALKGSALTIGPKHDHIDRVENGKAGTAMQAFKEQLNDVDLASVITYERNSWGNKAGIVQPSEVKAAR
jgi:cytochrome c oxidase subunit 2